MPSNHRPGVEYFVMILRALAFSFVIVTLITFLYGGFIELLENLFNYFSE